MPSQDAAMDVASVEAISVVFAAALVWVSALVQHISNVSRRGSQYAMSDRSAPPPMEGFFGRATRTLGNSIESALMYAPPMAVILLLHRSNWVSQLSAATYIGARVIFALAYWFKISGVRSLAWLVGMICCGAVAVSALVAVAGA